MTRPQKLAICAIGLLAWLATQARAQQSPAPSLPPAASASSALPDASAPPATPAATQNAAPAHADPGAAVCEIVYQMDNGIPGPRGYHYVFYGNGFFINANGDLLTAAHVLSQLHGGQPYLLLRDASGEPQFVRADLVAIDRDHDVAVLRATPNPFETKAPVSFLRLAPGDPMQGEIVEATSHSPSAPRDAYSLDRVREQHSAGEVLRFEFSKLDKNAPDTQLFLFNHKIQPGQSGSPVISESLQAVTGVVEGQWTKADASLPDLASESSAAKGASAAPQDQVAAIPGAAVPIHYALALLQRKGIAWTAAPSVPSDSAAAETASESVTALPRPLSLVAAPYPRESLFGGEVILSAAVAPNGTLRDVLTVQGDEPFLRKATDAIRTWTFYPTDAGGKAADGKAADGRAVEQRIAIVFQFPQPYVPPRAPATRHYDDDASSPASGAAIPLETVEAAYPPEGDGEGSAILYETIDAQGHLASVETVSGDEALAAAARDAAKQWQFSPAKPDQSATASAAVNSAAILVFTFRHPLSTSGTPQGGCVAKMCGDHRMCSTCNGTGNPTPKKN
jgi:TonB family protein